ncbi:hypothetical protein L332_03520 [Agrococcus pavilionensis RW1]|uniref:HNH nuclease domain-containing protein n=1 Tax=Agrococcus pavilionensis RW1 TaxID=1330458 RepID=U1L962_9MICO|nr:hypothetical protein [Agrococcus pavilionensis]ERG63523.1 hypothetical protein L332_03520 [Agrococcus pavilionensis RW1]
MPDGTRTCTEVECEAALHARGLCLRHYNADLARRRYWRRRDDFLAKHGNRCAQCGSTDRLQIDHIDPATKTMEPCHALRASTARYEAEMALCQLLCKSCHDEKTKREQTVVAHGTRAQYKRGCRCEPCRTNSITKQRAYRATLRAAANAA